MTFLPRSMQDDTDLLVRRPTTASPISEIPVDVLLEIFETLILAWDAVQIMPVLLCSVCTRWRDCVRNSPTLWSTIRTYEVLDLTTVILEHEIKRVKMFLRRSQGCPLTIDIAIYSYLRHEGEDNAWADSLPDFHDKLKELSQALGKHAHRIKSLTLVIDEYQSTTSILSGLKEVSMPMLTHWDVRNLYDENWSFDDENLEDEEVNAHSVLLHPLGTSEEQRMAMYPNLKFVSLHAVPLHWSRFSLNNLVTLEIRMIPEKWRPSASTFGRILRANAHSLERLVLSVALPTGIYLGEPIALPNLEWIELGFTHTAEIIPFINTIEVPILRVLILCDSRREYLPIGLSNDPAFDNGITDLFAVLVSRFPLRQLTDMTLRHIALCPVPSPSAEVFSSRMDIAIDFLRRLENLNFLTVSNSDVITLEALNRLQVRVEAQQPKHPLPKLTFLQITDTGYKILQDFLQQRLNGPNVYNALVALVITMPNSWYLASRWDTFNTKRLAQEVFPLVSRLSDDAEQQLAVT